MYLLLVVVHVENCSYLFSKVEFLKKPFLPVTVSKLQIKRFRYSGVFRLQCEQKNIMVFTFSLTAENWCWKKGFSFSLMLKLEWIWVLCCSYRVPYWSKLAENGCPISRENVCGKKHEWWSTHPKHLLKRNKCELDLIVYFLTDCLEL